MYLMYILPYPQEKIKAYTDKDPKMIANFGTFLLLSSSDYKKYFLVQIHSYKTESQIPGLLTQRFAVKHLIP